MAFPQDPRVWLAELQVGATDWANVTDYVFSQRAPVEITWGIPGEYSQSSPGTSSFHLNNKLGYFSPRNALSPLWNQIGRNTPVRLSIGEGAYGMVIGQHGDTEGTGRAATLDSAGTSITGDMDVRVDMEILEGSGRLWSTGNFDVASKFRNVDSDRSWTFIVVGGKLRFNWFSAGTLASHKQAESSVALSGTVGRKAVRVTIDVDNGFGGSDVEFWTAPTIDGTWTKLGSTITVGGASSIFDGGSWTRVGANPDVSSYSWARTPLCSVYEAEIYSGIDGTIRANPVFSSQPLDPVPFSPSNFSDAQGNNWFFDGTADAARIWYGDVDIRAHHESSSFPNRWDVSGNDAWVPIEAAGLLRRLGNGQEPAATGLRDWIMSQSPVPTSYFPLSGAEGTRYSLNLGDIGTNSLRFFPEGNPVFTYGKDFGVSWLGSGMELNATGPSANMRGDVVTSDDNFALDFVFQSPPLTTESGVDTNTNMGVLDIFIWSYDYDRWQLRLQDPANGGTLQLSWHANDGAGSMTFPASSALAALMDNEIHTCRFEIRSSGLGSQTAYVYIDGELIDTRIAAAGRDIRGVWLYQMFYSRYAGQTVMTLGHLTGWSEQTWPNAPDIEDFHTAAMGYSGEQAADRMERIAAIGDIPLTITGDNADTMRMGPQYSESKLTQLRDAEQADMGILRESRDRFGLDYRTRVSMVAQTPALTLSYASGHIVPPFEPTDDDQFTKNDFTATRREGDSYREQLLTGRLSVLEPPDGVGRYHDQREFNVETDAMLPGIAAWLVNLGTVDKARYPSVTVDLGNLVAAGLDAAARAVREGDLIVLTDMEELGVYEDVRLLVLGGREEGRDGAFKHLITWNCAPYQGYEGAVFATSASIGDARYDTAGSQLNTGVSSSATSISVAATGGTLWTTDPAAFPLDIMMGGERITISGCSGASSPQTMTASARSVNGVVKAHSAGADIRLADPTYYSL